VNDLEREIRDTLLRHQDDAPAFDPSEARRAAGRARQRQARNVAVGGTLVAAAAIVGIVGFGGFVRADRPPTVIDRPSPTPTCTATAEHPATKVLGWPDTTKNRAGVYSWGALERPSDGVRSGWMHNAYKPGSGRVEITMEASPGQLTPHGEGTAVTVAGCEGTYRRFTAELERRDGLLERWMVDIQGTTVTITLTAPGAPEDEVAEAHGIIESIVAVPSDDPYGFRLLFTLTTGTWDSG
jgi:hypothetical protein